MNHYTEAGYLLITTLSLPPFLSLRGWTLHQVRPFFSLVVSRRWKLRCIPEENAHIIAVMMVVVTHIHGWV